MPWSNSNEAFTWLPQSLQQRVTQASIHLDESWQSPKQWRAVLDVLETLFEGDRLVLHNGAIKGAPSWMLHTLNGNKTNTPTPKAEKLDRARMYAIDSVDPFQNRPVNLTTLAAGLLPKGKTSFNDAMNEVFHANEIHHQMRSAIYQGGVISTYIGVCRSKSQAPFTELDHALLFAVQPMVLRWVRLARALGVEQQGYNGLFQLVDATHRCALVIHEGKVLFCNESARIRLATESVDTLVNNAARRMDRIQLCPDGVPLTLYIEGEEVPTNRECGNTLPHRLQQVVCLLKQGAQDKDIAKEMLVSHATARTYVARAMKALNIHNRRERIRPSGYPLNSADPPNGEATILTPKAL